MKFFTCLVEDHDLMLVGLAALICVIGSLVTSRMFRKTRDSWGAARMSWLFMGAVAGGATIWCTHFVAMLAYRPGVDVSYAPVLTGVSLLIAIAGCAAALWLGARRVRFGAEIGGAAFGLTVTSMHYTGMAAFTAEALVIWSLPYVATSVVAAVVGGAAAFNLASRETKHGLALSTLALVLTIVALHFTGMGALTVLPLAPADGMLNGHDASNLMAGGVAVVGLLILGTAAASHVLEEQMTRLSRAQLNSLIQGSVDGMLVEGDGVILVANSAFAELCRVQPGDLTEQTVARWIEDAGQMPEGVLIQSRLTPVEGEPVPVEIAVRHETSQDGRRSFRIFAVRDLRARLAQERRITHLARNDSLTGLPNRASFLEKLNRAATGALGPRFALLAIDLDRFKEVNDLYGHAVGDHLLIHVAEQMKGALKDGEFVARLGGDEFVVITPAADRVEAMEAAERMRAAILTPTLAEHAEIQCGAAVGLALWPDDAEEPSVLINDADLAMYRAKASLTTDICFYEEAMDEAVRQRRRLTQGLREALENDRFELHYQLQASVETGQVTGYEALLRWRQVDGSYISPVDFIPVAEDTGMILPIGEWVLRRACTEAAGWTEPHRIAVNLSPVQLSHVDLPRLVHQILIDTGLSPSRLELEITETAMITDMERTIHVLRQLKLLGVSVAMDDFGTGYSSLSTLRAFPFDKIKLDRSFMSELDGSPQSRAIIRAVLALGESLDIPVLAEGVETQDQLEFLKAQGCDQVQGYLLGRPQRMGAEAGQAKQVVAA
ncbi:MAG TPA: EAL domain-containing protein [Brevundimonas sp.]|uniref:bifunctional diguanylate cyclase/phosphodiesterase n=1 Tax=Brevundimonas sp. TaxID=1871086 RepID=UPI00263690A8|nr:EAL domain-containing protein [Brevundimonas sp.]HRO33653.1 EAL domain-containing protein [Brevundimonas sp.]